jgi:hypothetical protein
VGVHGPSDLGRDPRIRDFAACRELDGAATYTMGLLGAERVPRDPPRQGRYRPGYEHPFVHTRQTTSRRAPLRGSGCRSRS